MDSDNYLISKLPSALFSRAEATTAGISRSALDRLLEEGLVERLGRNVYCIADRDLSEEDTFRLATAKVGTPSAICLISALAHYDLTDLIPKQTWIMVPSSKRSRHSDLRLLRSRNPHWKIGVERREGYWITTPERTIVDTLLHSRMVGSQIGVKALATAVRKRTVALSDVVELADKLQVLHRVQPYVEVLA
jgi:predicted transcriptional regulator of viral defense system